MQIIESNFKVGPVILREQDFIPVRMMTYEAAWSPEMMQDLRSKNTYHLEDVIEELVTDFRAKTTEYLVIREKEYQEQIIKEFENDS